MTLDRRARIGEYIGGSTAGAVTFIDSSNQRAQDATNFVWDNLNKRLGLGTGTSVPATTLDVRGRFFVDRTINTNIGNPNNAWFSMTNYFADGGVNYGELVAGITTGGQPYLQSYNGQMLRVNPVGNAVLVGARLGVAATTTPTGTFDLFSAATTSPVQRTLGISGQINPLHEFLSNLGVNLFSIDASGRPILHAQNEVRFEDAAGGQYAGIRAPATIGSSHTYTLPTALGTTDQELYSVDNLGNLGWRTPPSSTPSIGRTFALMGA